MKSTKNHVYHLTLVAIGIGAVFLTGTLRAEQKRNPNGVPDSVSDNPHLSKASTANPQPSVKLSPQDKSFISKAAAGGMMEVDLARIAEQQGKSDEVKKISRMMVTDHTKANSELMEIAKKKGLGVGSPATKPAFSSDSQFIAQMVSDHQADVKLFQQEAAQGTDSDLKAFANKTLPTLKRHLAMIESAHKKAK